MVSVNDIELRKSQDTDPTQYVKKIQNGTKGEVIKLFGILILRTLFEF